VSNCREFVNPRPVRNKSLKATVPTVGISNGASRYSHPALGRGSELALIYTRIHSRIGSWVANLRSMRECRGRSVGVGVFGGV